jgi:uncharacterized Fe-S radical SAM superfamily protein PflX
MIVAKLHRIMKTNSTLFAKFVNFVSGKVRAGFTIIIEALSATAV